MSDSNIFLARHSISKLFLERAIDPEAIEELAVKQLKSTMADTIMSLDKVNISKVVSDTEDRVHYLAEVAVLSVEEYQYLKGLEKTLAEYRWRYEQ